MYIDLLKERRTPQEEEVLSRLWRIETLLVDKGEEQITEQRRVITTPDLQETIMNTITTYRHSLSASIYAATFENQHNHYHFLTNPGKEIETVFSQLEITKKDEPILTARQSKGGYNQEPLFRFLNIRKRIEPKGWILDTDCIDTANGIMWSYMIENYRNIESIDKEKYGWVTYNDNTGS